MSLSHNMLQFIQHKNIATPYLLTNLEEVRYSYSHICKALPFATCYYAVKANPAEEVLECLHDQGAHFETASLNEISWCLQVGIPPSHILYGNTIKKATDIQTAYRKGIRQFVFDDITELEKLALHAPASHVLCRISSEGEGAVWPLSRKFGCSPEKAVELITIARERGLVPIGVSFHVGSEQQQLDAWKNAIASASKVFNGVLEHGIILETLDIGGGFPVEYDNIASPTIYQLGQFIESYIRSCFISFPKVIIEPGRFIVASSGTLVGEVILVSENRSDNKRWVYLDIGRYNGLYDATEITYPVITFKDGEKIPVTIAGPTADSADVIETHYCLPKTLAVGDKVMFLNAGAYSYSLTSALFNGFQPLQQYFVGVKNSDTVVKAHALCISELSG